jgi:hypothetical protein
MQPEMRCVFSTRYAGETGLLPKMEQGKAGDISGTVSVKAYPFFSTLLTQPAGPPTCPA